MISIKIYRNNTDKKKWKLRRKFFFFTKDCNEYYILSIIYYF